MADRGEDKQRAAVTPKTPPKPGERPKDLPRAEQAIHDFLVALGLNPHEGDLKGTPARVVEAWASRIIAGYDEDPSEALGRTFETSSSSTIAVRDVPIFSTCPHHLLPMTGTVHLAMAPNGQVPGFGGVARLIDALAHRLILQEELCQSIADAMLVSIGLHACVVVLEAKHTCVAVTDPTRQGALFRTTAVAGDPKHFDRLLQELGRRSPDDGSSSR